MTLVQDWRQNFASLVDEHQAMVYGIALHSLRDPATAEDIAQDVFLELYKNLHRVESEDHLRFWLRRVTARKCIDHVRWRRLRPKHGLDDVPEPASHDRPQDPLLSESLSQLVASLPDRMRMAVILRYQEDLGPEEIARVLETSTASAKSLVHRGLELLREKSRRAGLGGN